MTTRSNRILWLVAIVVAFGMFVYPGYAFTSSGERKPVVEAAPGETTTTVNVATTITTPTTTPVTTPTTTPVAPATTVPATPEPAPDPCAAEIAPEATVKVDKGCTVSGDVRASRSEARASTTGAIAYFDGKGTKSVTFMSEEGWIYAKWGGSISNKSMDEVCGDTQCLRNTWPQEPGYPDPEVAPKANAGTARTPTTRQQAPASPPATSPQATEPVAEPAFIDTCWNQFEQIPKGATVRIPAGCNLDAGDPHIDGYKFHDSRSSTCQVTVMKQAGNVTATYSPIGVSSRSPADLATAEGKNCEIKNWKTDVGAGDFENQTD